MPQRRQQLCEPLMLRASTAVMHTAHLTTERRGRSVVNAGVGQRTYIQGSPAAPPLAPDPLPCRSLPCRLPSLAPALLVFRAACACCRCSASAASRCATSFGTMGRGQPAVLPALLRRTPGRSTREGIQWRVCRCRCSSRSMRSTVISSCSPAPRTQAAPINCQALSHPPEPLQQAPPRLAARPLPHKCVALLSADPAVLDHMFNTNDPAE